MDNFGNLSTFVELLDTAGSARATQSGEKVQTVQRGKQALEFRLPLPNNVLSNKESIAWYRFRYRIGNSSGQISISQLISGFFELRVISAKDVLPGTTYRVRVRATNPFSNEPLGEVAIEIEVDLKLSSSSQTLALKGAGVTDTNGFAIVDFTIPTEAKLDEDGEIRVIGRKNNIVREAEQELRPFEDDVQFLTMTDKPIYQPEQTVNIRGILMKGGDAKVVLPNGGVEFTVTDDDDTVLYAQRRSRLSLASRQ